MGNEQKEIPSDIGLFPFPFRYNSATCIALHCSVAPLVLTPQNVVGVPAGSEVRLQCWVEAYPPSVNFWIKGTRGGITAPSSDSSSLNAPGTGGGGGNNERNILLTG